MSPIGTHLGILAQLQAGGAAALTPGAFAFKIDTQYASVANNFTIGHTGTEDWTVDWGDGNVETINSTTTHVYAATGVYQVQVYPNANPSLDGNWPTFYNSRGAAAAQIVEINQWGDYIVPRNGAFFTAEELVTISAPDVPSFAPGNQNNTFLNCYKLETITNLANWRFNGVNSMTNFFKNCRAFVGDGLDDVSLGASLSGVGSTREMFAGCWVLDVDLSNWDMTGNFNIYRMFFQCFVFNSPLPWTFNSSLVTTSGFLHSCYVWNQDVSTWNVDNWTNFNELFRGCAAFTGSGLSTWASKVTNVTNISHMLTGCVSFDGTGMEDWQMSSLTNVFYFAYLNTAFNVRLNPNTWDFSNVTVCSGMFYGCTSFQQEVYDYNWNWYEPTFQYMFRDTNLTLGQITNWIVRAAQSTPNTGSWGDRSQLLIFGGTAAFPASNLGSEAKVAFDALVNRKAYSVNFISSGTPSETWVTSSLMFAWDAAISASYSQSDSTLYDMSTNNVHGTLEGGLAWTGSVGGEFVFDGDDDVIRYGPIAAENSMSFSGKVSQSVEFWINPTRQGDIFQRIIDKSDGGSSANGWGVTFPESVGGDSLNYYTDGNSFGGSVSEVTSSAWNHVVITRGATHINYYVNGINVHSAGHALPSFPSTTTSMSIGSWNHSTGREFSGSIALMRVYDSALLASQVTTNYDTDKSRFGRT